MAIFFFIFSLVFAKLGTFKVGLDSHPNLPPQPGLANVVVSDCSLAAIQGQLLILKFLELHSRCFSSGSSLKPRKDLSNFVLSYLFHESKNTSSEEYLGVAKTELFFVQLNSVKYSSSSSFVIFSLSNQF